MKPSTLLLNLLACGAVLLVGCDRKTVATAILTVGFNVRMTTGAKANLDLADNSTTPCDSPLDDLLRELDQLEELRGTSVAAGQVDAARWDELFERIGAAADASERSHQFSDTEKAQAREATLVALTRASEVLPATYQARREAYLRTWPGPSFTQTDAANAAVQRFVTSYLIQQVAGPEAMRSLALHAATYPDCETNVELYLTLVERLANEDQLADAVSVARDGLRRCAGHGNVRRIQERLERLYVEHAGTPGLPMNFAGPTLNQDRFELASLRGKRVLVVFWATWCPACREEMPVINELRRRYRKDGLEVVGVSLDNNQAELARFVANQKLDWTQVITPQRDRSGWNNPIAKYYGVDSIPRAFLLDAQGVIAETGMHGESEFEAAIVDLLARQ